MTTHVEMPRGDFIELLLKCFPGTLPPQPSIPNRRLWTDEILHIACALSAFAWGDMQVDGCLCPAVAARVYDAQDTHQHGPFDFMLNFDQEMAARFEPLESGIVHLTDPYEGASVGSS